MRNPIQNQRIIAEELKPQFYTETGWLTKYGLACGYIEKHEEKGIRTTLWYEGCVYHVLQFNTKREIRVFWDTFDSNELEKARKKYSWAIKKVSQR